MPTKTILFIITIFLSFSTTVLAESAAKKQSVESSLMGGSRWKNNNEQSAESIIRDRQRPEERQYMKNNAPKHIKKYTKHVDKSPRYYEQQRLKEKYQNNPAVQ